MKWIGNMKSSPTWFYRLFRRYKHSISLTHGRKKTRFGVASRWCCFSVGAALMSSSLCNTSWDLICWSASLRPPDEVQFDPSGRGSCSDEEKIFNVLYLQDPLVVMLWNIHTLRNTGQEGSKGSSNITLQNTLTEKTVGCQRGCRLHCHDSAPPWTLKEEPIKNKVIKDKELRQDQNWCICLCNPPGCFGGSPYGLWPSQGTVVPDGPP